MEKSAISIRSLSFSYASREEFALKDISFDLQPGELMLLAGASGCGKSTLMRCINGLIPYTYSGTLEGEIEIFGERARSFSLSELSAQVGTILQNPELQIVSSIVRNEVAFGLENLGLETAEIIERVDKVLADLNISHLAHRETFSLSGGEKQKVALAGVLVMEPKILLLDEPLAALDSASAHEALEIFRRLADEGIAVLLVEHRVDDVLSIHPDSVIYMDEGEIKYQGHPEGLMSFADYNAVKLPAEVTFARAKNDPPEEFHLAVGVSNKRGEASDPLLKFENVDFSYDKGLIEVLKDVNLEINRGDVVALLGPNGAGKTTLVKHSLGLLKPVRGAVSLNGINTNEISVAQAARSIGYVFQDPGQMLFAPTVYEELAFGPKNLQQTPEEIEKNVDWALSTVNLTELAEVSPLSLSFGQQKRVSIAAILSMQSRILVMDEPTAGQDYWNYRSFMDSILQMPGFEAVIFITHDLDLAITYANRIILINEGSVEADGSPYQVLKDKEMLRRCRIVPTSLLDLNLKYYSQTDQFMSGQRLAHAIHAPHQ